MTNGSKPDPIVTDYYSVDIQSGVNSYNSNSVKVQN